MINTMDLWRILGCDASNGSLMIGTIIKPMLGLRPSRSARRSMPPGRTATSPRGTTAIWRRRDGMSGAGRGCRRLHGVAGSGSDKQPRALRGAAGSDPDRNQGGLLRDCDARPAAEVICNGHGYVLAALFQCGYMRST